MSDHARMVEWTKSNPEAAARELIEMEGRYRKPNGVPIRMAAALNSETQSNTRSNGR